MKSQRAGNISPVVHVAAGGEGNSDSQSVRERERRGVNSVSQSVSVDDKTGSGGEIPVKYKY